MDSNEISLKDVLELKSDEQLCPKFSKMETLDLINKVKENVGKFKGIKWPGLYDEILKRAAELFDLKIVKIITDAWINYDISQKFTDIKEANEDEIVLIPVAEHCIESTHSPCLEILLNNSLEAKINFEINLSFNLKGIILKFRNKKLIEIHTGECTISGTVNCENVEIIVIESKTIDLPGIIKCSKTELVKEAVIS